MAFVMRMHAESNESMERLKRAETRVQENLNDFARTDRYEYIVQAREEAFSRTKKNNITPHLRHCGRRAAIPERPAEGDVCLLKMASSPAEVEYFVSDDPFSRLAPFVAQLK